MSDLKLLSTLCSLPTVPFGEEAVLAFVRRWATTRKLKVTADRAGNLLLERPGPPRKPRLVLVAHADHPGFVAEDTPTPGTLHARFHGGVASSFFTGSPVRFFVKGSDVLASVREVRMDDGRPAGATLDVDGPVPPGTPGMWDVGTARIDGDAFHCRVCDDLAGLAAGLQALATCRTPAAVLVTRGEEEGFIGAIAAARSGRLLRKTNRVISIECSAEQPYARRGDGMVVRTGDRTSVFHSAFTRFLTTRAEALAKTNPAFKFQRALMPGGTCEGTVFDAYGFVAAAVCVPLGNYHNMDKASGKIAAESVDLRDWRSLVALLTDVCRTHAAFTGDHADLREKLDARYAKFTRYLTPTARSARRPARPIDG